MKVTIIEETNTQDEVIIKCSNPLSPEIQNLLLFLEDDTKRIPVYDGEALTLLHPQDVLYGECVDKTVFVYTAHNVFSSKLTLMQLEHLYRHFFRCSKSTVVNLKQMMHLKSELNGRILVTLMNEEKILISRHYASHLRKRLKEM